MVISLSGTRRTFPDVYNAARKKLLHTGAHYPIRKLIRDFLPVDNVACCEGKLYGPVCGCFPFANEI